MQKKHTESNKTDGDLENNIYFKTFNKPHFRAVCGEKGNSECHLHIIC